MPKPLTCSVCDEEVRWGHRDGELAWWHREGVDHVVKFGAIMSQAETDAMYVAIRQRYDDDHEEAPPAEPIEVRSTPMPLKGSMSVDTIHGPREVKTPGGARTLLNLAAKVNWEVQRLTYSRGPYLGAKSESLGVSDSVVLILRGPVVDEGRVWAVACWRDGKSDWAWRIEKGRAKSVGARALIAWMKETPNGQNPE